MSVSKGREQVRPVANQTVRCGEEGAGWRFHGEGSAVGSGCGGSMSLSVRYVWDSSAGAAGVGLRGCSGGAEALLRGFATAVCVSALICIQSCKWIPLGYPRPSYLSGAVVWGLPGATAIPGTVRYAFTSRPCPSGRASLCFSCPSSEPARCRSLAGDS